MSIQVSLIGRAVRTIKSCETKEQFDCAVRYCALIVKRYAKLTKNDTIWASMDQACKAMDLAKELDQLCQQQTTLDRVTARAILMAKAAIAKARG